MILIGKLLRFLQAGIKNKFSAEITGWIYYLAPLPPKTIPMVFRIMIISRNKEIFLI